MGIVRCVSLSVSLLLMGFPAAAAAQNPTMPVHPIVLHAARLLDIKNGRIVKPGEVLVQGERIVEAGTSVKRPAAAEVIDLGDRTLLPGLIDAHVHLFLHPGAEDLQTVQESVPQRTIMALLAARDDLMAGFTAERDMGTEGAGSADTAVRDAIDAGRIPGPRLRISGNAVNILGGHEDAIGYNPEQHVLPNADYTLGPAPGLSPSLRLIMWKSEFVIYTYSRSARRIARYLSNTFLSLSSPRAERIELPRKV
jgi:hypothetical protein